MSADAVVLLSGAVSAFGLGWVFGRGIKTVRQFLEQTL